MTCKLVRDYLVEIAVTCGLRGKGEMVAFVSFVT